jgi:large subunit ribosomal protein L24
MSARLRKGDLVVVISGKNKGKQGKISRIWSDTDRVLVEGVNLIKRHMRPTPKNPQGGILEREAPLHACKVMPVDPKTGKPTRVRTTTDAKGHKTRIAVKSGEELPSAARDGVARRVGNDHG